MWCLSVSSTHGLLLLPLKVTVSLLTFIILMCVLNYLYIDCVPHDCKDILRQSQLQKKSICSGIYTIKPDNKPPFKVNIQ